jgi:hypothetical protein
MFGIRGRVGWSCGGGDIFNVRLRGGCGLGGGYFRRGGVGEASFVVSADGGEGAEQKAIDVGENGSTTGGDVIVREEYIEVAEGVIDALGGLEALGAGEKGGFEIEAVGFVELLGMSETKGSAGGNDSELATTTGGPAVLAASRVIGGIDFSGLRLCVF